MFFGTRGELVILRREPDGADVSTMIALIAFLNLTITIGLSTAAPGNAISSQARAEGGPVNAEEYRVYSALIDQKHSELKAKRMYTIQGELVNDRLVLDELKLIVIESNTRASFDYKPMNHQNLSHTLDGKMPRLVEETFQDFTDKNRQSYTLKNRFSSKIKTEVISEQQRQFYFINNTGRWDPFFKRFPGSQGTVAFSRVGFSPRKDKALVYVEAQQDFTPQFMPLWTWDTYFALLTKGKRGWMIHSVYYPNRPPAETLKQRYLTVDLARCPAVSRHLAWGLGSERVEIIGLQGDECVLQHLTEIEGGYRQSECRVSVLLADLSIEEGRTSFYFSHDLSKHCKIIKTGNLFFDALKPESPKRVP